DGPVQHSAHLPRWLHLPDRQHADRLPLHLGAVAGDALHPHGARHLSPRRGSAPAAARARAARVLRHGAPADRVSHGGVAGMRTRTARSLWSDVLAVAYKEAMALRHDRPLMATLLVQPVTFLIILGTAVSFTPRHVHWAVLDRSETAVSRRLVSEIGR